MTPFTIAVIMKNEEKHIDNFLSAIEKHFSRADYEVVINDTGSTDKSVDIALSHNARVIHSEWVDDFSYSRNLVADAAIYDDILVLDCDEYIVNAVCCDSLIPDSEMIGRITITNHFIGLNENDTYTTVLPRIYNRRYAHFEGTVHEQIVPLDNKTPCYFDSGISVEHFGYFGTPEELSSKTEKYEKLLLNELNNKPDDPYIYFQLGQSRNMIKDFEKAVEYYAKGLSFSVNPTLEYVKMMITSLGNNLIRLGKPEEAMCLEVWHDHLKNDSDYLCMLGLAYLRSGKPIDAMQTFLSAMSANESKTRGSSTYIPLYNMGVINEMLGNKDGAIELYKKCGNYGPALDKLKDLNG